MILPTSRRAQILADIRENRAVEVGELTKRYGVSTSTIRRDLDELAERGDITRVHGGALAPGFADFTPTPAEPPVLTASDAVAEPVLLNHRAAG